MEHYSKTNDLRWVKRDQGTRTIVVLQQKWISNKYASVDNQAVAIGNVVEKWIDVPTVNEEEDE